MTTGADGAPGTEIAIELAPVFRPLAAPARYKGAWGGRGSGKSQFFADLMIASALRRPGFRALCGREVQKSLKESAKRLIELKIANYALGSLFRVTETQIRTPGNGLIVFVGLQDHTAESIKSYEGFDVAWVEEAQTVSRRSLALLRPTIRAPGSELWFSWNPRRENDPVDKMLRGPEVPTGASVVRANWCDNPWFPAELEQERRDCLRATPDQYDHVWNGGYVTAADGAYFAKPLAEARGEGRIGAVAIDPLLTVRLFLDIGGTGARADACAIWAAQFVGRAINFIDYYEAVGQPLAAHVAWLRGRDYGPDRARIWLPHDGATRDRVFSASYESALRDAGYAVAVVPNQGKGAAAARIEAARRLFPRIWFDAARCDAGLKALGWYHEKKDDARDVGLGPAHDWSSHGSDAFGLACIAHEEPRTSATPPAPPRPGGAHSWMGI
jgi:phage terminase large subunit